LLPYLGAFFRRGLFAAAFFNSSACCHAARVTSSSISTWSAYPMPVNDVSQSESSSSSSVVPLSVSYQIDRRGASGQPQ